MKMLRTVLAALMLLGMGRSLAHAGMVLLTSDTEGHVSSCAACPGTAGLGGMDRRAAVVGAMRAEGEVLLLDAGNALFGGDSLASRGKVIVAAYNAMGYDAVNLSFRDFRLGKAATLAAIEGAEFDVVSANLVDEETGELLVKPFVVKELGGMRVAVVGVTGAPAGLTHLPHLQEQLAGVGIAPVVEALETHLPAARAVADRVVVLYYGSAVGLREVRERFGEEIDLVLVGGMGVGDVPMGGTPAVVGTHRHGTHLARVELAAEGAGVEQIAIEPSMERDAAMVELLEEYLPARAHEQSPPASVDEAALPAEMEMGRSYRLGVVMQNRGARVTIGTVSLEDRYGELEAEPERRLLVLGTQWENIIPLRLIADDEVPTEYGIPNLGDHLYLVINGARVGRLAPWAETLPGHVPVKNLKLERIGDRLRGNVVFEVPAAGLESAQLRFYDFAHGHMDMALMGGAEAPAVEAASAVGELRKNEVVEAGVFDLKKVEEVDGRRAPEGMQFVMVEVRARSMFTYEADATAFDPQAERGDKVQIGTVSDWTEAHKYMQLVVDGEYAYLPAAELTELSDSPRFLPDVMTGGQVVFVAPKEAKSLALRCDFPNARLPGGEVIRGTGLEFPLEGQRPAPVEREAIVSIDDDVFHVSVTGQRVAGEFAGRRAGEGQRLLVLHVTVENRGEQQEFFQTAEQLKYVQESGNQLAMHEATFEGIYRPSKLIYIPAGERRSFEVAYVVPEGETRPRLAYAGVSKAEVVALGGMDEAVGEAGLAPTQEAAEEAERPREAVVEAPVEAAEEERIVEAPSEPPGEMAEGEPAEPEVGRVRVVHGAEVEEFLRAYQRTSINVAQARVGGVISFETKEGEEPPGRLDEMNNGRFFTQRHMRYGPYVVTPGLDRQPTVHAAAVYLGRLNDQSRVSMKVEGLSPEGEWRLLGLSPGAEIRAGEDHLRLIEFDPVRVNQVRITLDGPERIMRLLEVMVFEGPLDDLSQSIISQGGHNISRIDFDGSVFHAERMSTVGHLVTAPQERADFGISFGRQVPEWSQPVTFAFAANREALTGTVSLHEPSLEDRLETMPARVRLSASLEHPFEGYETIGEFDVPPAGQERRIELPRPVLARFLRVEFGPREGADRLDLGEFAVFEATEPGYVSVLIRDDGADWRQRPQATLASLLGEDYRSMQRLDPGSLSADAPSPVDVPLGQWVGSVLERPGEHHVLRFNVAHDEATEIPELTVQMAPFHRARVRLLDAEQNMIEQFGPGEAATTLQFARAIPPGNYSLELTSAPVYLFMGFDTSGSMGRALPITRTTLPELLEDLPAGFHVALGDSVANRETGKRFTLRSGYSRDIEALKQANEELFDNSGGSDWYNFLRDMMEWADENTPEDAVGALALVADGVGSGDYDALWDRLRQSQLRLYTVGWGEASYRLDHVDHNTGWTAARGLFNTAWYRNGRYFEPQLGPELVQTYRGIMADLQEPAEYAVRITVRERRDGLLITRAPEGEDRPVLIVLDASGSMMERMGDRTRMEVAIDVIDRVIQRLPDDAQVGLRVYGHRYRIIDGRDLAATDSELLIPIGPLDRSAFMNTVRGINARGGTPLAHSIEQAAGDIRRVERPRVVLLTDGVESFRRDPVAAARALRAASPEMDFAVVGFAIGQVHDKENLQRMAEAGGGAYYDAEDPESLVRSVDEAMNPRVGYAVVDGQGREVARGVFGDQQLLWEGQYETVIRVGGEETRLPVRLSPGGRVSLSVPVEVVEALRRGGRSEIAAAGVEEHAADGARTEEREAVAPVEVVPVPAPAARFCTQCGGELAAGARFCTGCGAAAP